MDSDLFQFIHTTWKAYEKYMNSSAFKPGTIQNLTQYKIAIIIYKLLHETL